MDGVELFDHRFFNLSLKAAGAMPPEERLLLESGQEALESAGIGALSLRRAARARLLESVGVFIGQETSDWLGPPSIVGDTEGGSQSSGSGRSKLGPRGAASAAPDVAVAIGAALCMSANRISW